MYIYPTPLAPKIPGGALNTLALGRVSKPKATESQTNQDLQSSFAVVRQVLAGHYEGPINLTELGEQESGLIADRATALEAIDMVATGDLDLVIAEDLSKVFRNPRFQWIFVQDAVDAGTRVILFSDNLDTADPDWEIAMGVATLRHGLYIPDARRRVRRTATFAFHNGGQVQKLKFGYRKLTTEQAQSGEFGPVGLKMAKDSDSTPAIKKMRELLMTPLNGIYSYKQVVDWLQSTDVPTGPYVKGEWNQRLVKSLLTDPILIGTRQFRTLIFDRIHSTGRFRRRENPDGPETEQYPELAHLTDDEFVTMQEVIDEIADQNRNRSGANHPLYRRPRKDSFFPRQLATCAICDGLMYSYDSNQLKCQNAHAQGVKHCWNHVQVNVDIAREKFFSWFVGHLSTVPGLRELVVDQIHAELTELESKSGQCRTIQNSSIQQLKKEAKRLAKAIRKAGEIKALVEESIEIEDELQSLLQAQEKDDIEAVAVPTKQSLLKLDEELESSLNLVALRSFAFASLLREIIPRFEIVPVQALDTGLVRPRLRFTLNVGALFPLDSKDNLVPPFHGELNLFEYPKKIRYMQMCLDIKSEIVVEEGCESN